MSYSLLRNIAAAALGLASLAACTVNTPGTVAATPPPVVVQQPTTPTVVQQPAPPTVVQQPGSVVVQPSPY